MANLERKLMKFWIQSFLLGVPKIIVGFRTPHGFLKRIEEMDTASIPSTVKRVGKGTWDGNMCINFAAALLDCKYNVLPFPATELNHRSHKSYSHWGWCLEDQEEGTLISHRDIQDRRDWPWWYCLGRIHQSQDKAGDEARKSRPWGLYDIDGHWCSRK